MLRYLFWLSLHSIPPTLYAACNWHADGCPDAQGASLLIWLYLLLEC
jgi:hypothetical protein